MSCDGLVRVIPPITVTDAMLSGINVPENDHAEYAAGTSYSVDDKVMVTDAGIHQIYQSSAAGNAGNYPPDNPLQWVSLGATNRWAMFDGEIQTTTDNANSITFTITPNRRIDAIAFQNLAATGLQVTVTDGSNTLFSRAVNLVDFPDITDMYLYLTAEYDYKKAVAITDIPAHSGAEISVTITGGAGTSVGMVILGKQVIVGKMLYSHSVEIVRTKREALGLGAVVKRGTIPVLIENQNVDRVIKSLGAVLDVTCAHVCGSRFESELIVGKYEQLSVEVRHSAYAESNLQIQGVI